MLGGHYKPLTQVEMACIHALVLQLLEDLGLSQVTPSLEVRAIEAGCWVDDNNRLRFPRALVEDMIAGTRRKFTLHGIDPVHDIEIGGRRVHTGTVRKVLAEHYPSHIDAQLRDHFNIILPKARMRAGNGVW